MQPAQILHPHRRMKRYAPAALGATLLLALAACSGGGGTSASPSATATPSHSATSAKATPSPTRTDCGGNRHPRHHHDRKRYGYRERADRRAGSGFDGSGLLSSLEHRLAFLLQCEVRGRYLRYPGGHRIPEA